MSEVGRERDKPSRDLIYFPVVFNLVGLFCIGLLYAFSPGHMVEPETFNTVLYLGVFITEWVLALVVIRRIGMSGLKELMVPKKRLRWAPSILVFVSLNAFFTAYMVLALRYGRIPPWGNLNALQILFFIVLNPITAGFSEELIWRGYFIERLLAAGRTEWKAIVYSSISFAFIHGLIIFDKLAVTFIFGLIAGAYYVRERNLPVLMASHIALDVIAFALAVFSLV